MLSSKIKEWKLSKYKKTVPFYPKEGQMHLYSCDYLYFYATIVMKQYLTFYAHLLQIVQLFSISIYTQLCIVPL